MLGQASALDRTGAALVTASWGQGATDQGIRTRDRRAPSHGETEESRDSRVSNTGMRGRELRVVVLSPLQQKPVTATALNSYQSTMNLEQ